MVLFNKEKGAKGYELIREGKEDVMRIDYENINYVPSLEDNSSCMADAISKLLEAPYVSRIVFTQRRNYQYDYTQIQLLIEIATVYNHLTKQRRFLVATSFDNKYLMSKSVELQTLLNMLKGDPIGTFVTLKRILREQKIILRKLINEEDLKGCEDYIKILTGFYNLLDKTKLITIVKPRLDGHKVGDRSLYSQIFRAVVTPDFMFARLMARVPLDGEEIDSYMVDKYTNVSIFKVPNDIKYLYHLSPPEFKISEDKYELLDMARSVLIKHKPKAEDFIDPDKMRMTFFNIGKDLLQELSEKQGVKMTFSELKDLTNILVRYTVGFGLIEVLLKDEKIQDITVNSPIGQTPIFIVHQDFDECITNIIPSQEDAQSWATKFRMLSGRPLDEANPILDTELVLPEARSRVAIVSTPLSPWGLAYAFRRHRDKPWTFPLFIENKMISPLAAGLMSFLIDGARTMLIAGTRSSGKTSLLGASLIEIMRKYRIITIEDTLELPTDSLRQLGYNIQSMKVRSALTSGETEVSADEGIRSSLRMGDSALIVGEIRSLEAKALYEAMRIGALANVVAGTIHGESPYGVYDRVVNDLQVPKTSFKATDLIVIANPIKSPDGLRKWKRVIQITEVRKEWEEDPLREGGFVDLMKYDTKSDSLKATDDLINGNSEIIKGVAANVSEWVGNWDAVWDNIILRAKIKEALVTYSKKIKNKDILEAKFVVLANDQFHRISNSVKEDVGYLDPRRIYFEWEDWLKKILKNG